MPGQHSIERWLIKEQLTHILMAGYRERIPPESSKVEGCHRIWKKSMSPFGWQEVKKKKKMSPL